MFPGGKLIVCVHCLVLAILCTQNDDREARKAELIEEHEQAKAAREESGEEPDEEEEEDFLMQLKDIESEVYEEEADPQVLEEEAAAKERVETAIVEKVEEQTGTTASLKVSAAVLFTEDTCAGGFIVNWNAWWPSCV